MLLLTHALYFAVIVYGYKAFETFQVQRRDVPFKDAVMAGIIWPKYYFNS
jgi:hypothetical protein